MIHLIHRRSTRSRAFTLIELLVTLAMIGILAFLLMQAASRARNWTTSIRCVSNLRTIGLAFQGYLNDHDGIFPDSIGGGSSNRWLHALDGYVEAEDQVYGTTIFHCPLTKKPTTDGTGLYGFNDYLAGSPNSNARRKAIQIKNPTRLVVMAEHAYNVNQGAHLSPDFPYPESLRGAAANHEPGKTPAAAGAHGRGNYLFADWHVETLTEWPGTAAFRP